MGLRTVLCAGLLLTSSAAIADTRIAVTPKTARPGDAVLVTVTGTRETPKGTENGTALQFFASKGGYQALFAIPLDTKPSDVTVEVDSAVKPVTVQVRAVTFPETSVIVEDELANPPKADRDRIDADNKAILEAVRGKEAPEFSRSFRRPPGEVTSTFGEWRTFNDGHRSQHLGFDLFAREGSKVKAINAGTVTLVRETFLAGNIVVVEHGAGIASTYYHLSKVSVAQGDVLQAGAEVGLAGHTGRATGPHLHLSVRVPGGFVDPATFFKLAIAPRPPATAARK